MRKTLILVLSSLIVGFLAGYFLLNSSKRTVFQSTAEVEKVPSPTLASAPGAHPPASNGPSMNKSYGSLPATSAFASLSRAEQAASIEQLKAKDAPSLFQIWLAAGRSEHDLVKQQVTGTVLGYALRKEPPDVATLADIRGFIDDDSNPERERELMLIVLGQAGAVETLNLLIQTATTTSDPDLKRMAATQIAYGADFRSDGNPHEELSPLLEGVWANSDDKPVLASVAQAMASVGSPSSVEKLLASATDTSPKGEARAGIAMAALLTVRNPHAIPVLSAHLAVHPAVDKESYVECAALTSIGRPEAIKAVVGWLEQTDDSAAPMALKCVSRSRTKSVIQEWQSSLDPSVPFHSEIVRDAIRSALAQHQHARERSATSSVKP